MFNINTYETYKVLETIKDCYKSYDSDVDDWFKEDEYNNEYELDGVDLINKIVEKLTMENFGDCEINNGIDVVNKKVQKILRLDICTFDPTDGTMTYYTYIIKPIEMEGNEE